MARYTIVSTEPSVYQAKDKSIVNGVLVRFNIQPYDEVHQVHIPKMDVSLAKAEIERVVDERDALAGLSDAED